MKIIEPFVELINAPDYKTLLTTIEAAGRTCYKSEDKITDGSAEKFVRGIIKRGHEAVIEHGSLTVRFICDRGVSHEIVHLRQDRLNLSYLGAVMRERRSCLLRFAERGLHPAGSPICSSKQLEDRGGHDR